MSNAEDLEAINYFITNAIPKNTEASNIRSRFLSWYGGINTTFYVSDGELATGKSYRDQFNTANKDALSFKPRELTEQEYNDVQNLGSVELPSSSTQSERKQAAWGPKGEVREKSGKNTTVANVAPNSTTISTSKNKKYPVLKRFANNDPLYVKEWQKITGQPEDGKFGPGLEGITKKWQTEHGLQATGVVDGATWARALGAPTQTVPTNEMAASASKPKVPTTKTFNESVAEIPQTKESPTIFASILSPLTNIPTWGKYVLGLSLIGLMAYATADIGNKKTK